MKSHQGGFMKYVSIPILAVALACATGRQMTYTGQLIPAQDGFAVSMQQLAVAGYAVVNASEDAGFIQAERRGTGRFPWITKIDIITVTIGPETFTVVTRTDEIGAFGGRQLANPSRAVKAMGDQIRISLAGTGEGSR